MTAEGRGGDGPGRRPPRGLGGASGAARRPRGALCVRPRRGAPAPRGSGAAPGAEQPSGRRWRRAGGRGGPGGGGGGLLARLVSIPENYLPPTEIIFVAVVAAFAGRTRPPGQARSGVSVFSLTVTSAAEQSLCRICNSLRKELKSRGLIQGWDE